VASFVLAISRAVGETMIVLIAAGGRPSITLNPLEQIQTMTAFIARHRHGRRRAGFHRLQDDLRRRAHAVRHHVDLNAISIRLVRRFRQVYE
jgi:phosphate transport system permease protein